jgi:hypothetical protein
MAIDSSGTNGSGGATITGVPFAARESPVVVSAS